jgi:hypothetical protein
MQKLLLSTTEIKTSPSEWNNQQEGEKGFVGVFEIQPSRTTKDSYFKNNV